MFGVSKRTQVLSIRTEIFSEREPYMSCTSLPTYNARQICPLTDLHVLYSPAENTEMDMEVDRLPELRYPPIETGQARPKHLKHRSTLYTHVPVRKFGSGYMYRAKVWIWRRGSPSPFFSR